MQGKRRKPARRARLSVEPLEARELLDAAENLNFVGKVYQDLLHRTADAGGLANFSNALNSGALTRTGVALAILGSPEYRADLVQGLYDHILHRGADPGGLNSFTGFLVAGHSPEQVSAYLAGSPEYFQTRAGNSNTAFVDALYADFLGRPADLAGRLGFDQALAAGSARTQIADAILQSGEYRQDLVQGFYQQFLHRAADTAGLFSFVMASQSGVPDNNIIAGFLASAEYAPGADPAPDPTVLTPYEVGTLLQRAAGASASRDAIIVVVDRAGNVLGVRVEGGVSPALLATMGTTTFAIDGAVAEARTAAFFANEAGIGTPLTSRTIRNLSQTTMTQREVMSSPDVTDPNSPLRGPGFVAPIGIGGHFPPNIPFTPQVDLFNIEASNRVSLNIAGVDGVNRQSYGVVSGSYLSGQSRGIGTLPGGIPIFKKDGAGNDVLVGGIGVFFPGATGFATEENSSLDFTYNPAKRDRSVEAEVMAFSAVGGAPGIAFGVGTVAGIPALPEIIFPVTPNSRIDLNGITLDIVGPGGPTLGPQFIAAFSKTLGTGNPNDGLNYPIVLGASPMSPAAFPPPTGPSVNTTMGSTVPEGWLVAPHAGTGTGLTADDVVRIITQGIAQAVQTRAAIRLPEENTTRMVFSVSDRNGNVLGLYRMPDATVFSLDVAVAKSRNTAYYADPAQLQPIDQTPGIPPGVAFSNRTFRYLALPHFPEGIDSAAPGPFSILNDPNIDPKTGLQSGPALPPAAYQSVQGHDAFFAGTNFHQVTTPANLGNQNGIIFFPGGVPLYKDVDGSGRPILVGGLGVSGDGVDQDDVVTFAASQGYQPPINIPTADQFFVRGVRLPYQKFNRNPQG